MADWRRAREAAGALLPTETWRQALADAVYETGEVSVAGVFTCHPGQYLRAEGAAAPLDLGPRIRDTFLQELLPRIERRGSGAVRGKALGCAAYAPLEPDACEGEADLVAAVDRLLLAPTGAAGLVNIFLFEGRGEIVGWISLATRRPSAEALALFGDELTEVARLASATIRAAVDLASSCGAVVPDPAAASLAILSPREREIVHLVAQGFSDLNIAGHLGISENTVGVHLRRVYSKLQVHSRVELLLFAGAWASRRSRPSPD